MIEAQESATAKIGFVKREKRTFKHFEDEILEDLSHKQKESSHGPMHMRGGEDVATAIRDSCASTAILSSNVTAWLGNIPLGHNENDSLFEIDFLSDFSPTATSLSIVQLYDGLLHHMSNYPKSNKSKDGQVGKVAMPKVVLVNGSRLSAPSSTGK